MKVFYKESSSSEDNRSKKATIKAEAKTKTVAGRKFPSPDAQRVCRSTTQNFSSVQATQPQVSAPGPWPFV